jgi:enoyl-CoA hydratase/carnithine racemase
MVDEVIVTRTGAVLEIRMNRPAKKNALTQAMYGAMADAIEEAEQDGAIGAVLITAEGDLFTAGNDLADFQMMSQDDSAIGRNHVGRFLRALATMEKPLVAAASGGGVGIGLTMLLHCDIVVAAEDAQFLAPFTQLGVTPEAASSLLLPAQIGYKKAYMMLALGQPVTGKEAVEIGIATFAVPRDEVELRARKAAQECCARPVEAMKITKRLLRNSQALLERLEIEQKYFSERLRSPEARAAFAAFLKR